MSGFTLYELTDSYLNLLNVARTSDEESDIQLHLDNLKDAIEVKLDGYAVVISELEADIDKFTKEKKRIDAVIRQRKNAVERLRSNAEYNMEIAELEQVETERFNFRFRQNPPSVEILDEALIPEEYFRTKKEVNKSEIKKAISEGKEVSGASLVTRTRLEIK